MGFSEQIAAADELALETFGVDATYKAAGSGSGSPVRGIFDDSFTTVDQFNGGVQTTSPEITVRAADVPGITTEGSTMTIGATVYYVKGIEPAGAMMKLQLSKDP